MMIFGDDWSISKRFQDQLEEKYVGIWEGEDSKIDALDNIIQIR